MTDPQNSVHNMERTTVRHIQMFFLVLMRLFSEDNGKAGGEECHVSTARSIPSLLTAKNLGRNSNANTDARFGEELRLADSTEATNQVLGHWKGIATSNYAIKRGSRPTAEMKAAFLMIGQSVDSLGHQACISEENDINKS